MLNFRIFDPQESLIEQRALFKACFPESQQNGSATETHYSWKFHSLPHQPTAYEYAAWHQEQLVGYYAALPFRYKINDTVMTCAMVCDVMTSTTMRGQGVFAKLGAYATDALKDQSLDFCSGYPIRPEVLPGHLKVGWKVVFELPMYLKLLRVNSLLTQKKLDFLAPVVNTLIHGYQSTLQYFTCRKSNLQLHAYMGADFGEIKGYEGFYQAWQSSIPHALIKDPAFMNWRLSAPKAQYQVLAVYQQETLLAIAVVRKTNMQGIPCLAILDIMLKPGQLNDQKLLGYLHRELTRVAVSVQAEALVSMLSKHWAKRYALIKHGFLKSPFVFKLIIKQLSTRSQGTDFLSEKNWHLMWIDSDDL